MIPSFEYVIENNGISAQEAREISELRQGDLVRLLGLTDAIRRQVKGNSVNLCSIVNAKSGLCPEDCRFCAQSAHYKTDVKNYSLISAESIVDRAKRSQEWGVRGFSIVTSGYGIENQTDLKEVARAVKGIAEQTPLYRCASLGILTEQELANLKGAGLTKYHHNLETARSFFPAVCSTHPYEDDIEAVRSAKRAGLEVCCGGVFGIGESWDQRIELAFTLKELGVDSVPINFLNPVVGTPFENMRLLTPFECLKIVSLFRLILPDKDIVVCGGREVNLRDMQSMIFYAGANGMMVGGYLTTHGRPVDIDRDMVRDLGLEVTRPIAV